MPRDGYPTNNTISGVLGEMGTRGVEVGVTRGTITDISDSQRRSVTTVDYAYNPSVEKIHGTPEACMEQVKV